MLLLDKYRENHSSKLFCQDFLDAKSKDRYIFGINKYANEIAQSIDVAGFIDDFTSNVVHQGKPVIKSNEIPDNCLVVSSLLGRPLTAKKVLTELGVRHLDYFAFYTYSGLIKHPVPFWGDGKKDIDENKEKYLHLYSCLKDGTSKDTLKKIINFRATSDLDYLDGFYDRQKEQYFEPFFKLYKENEVFVDVGGFDGETSLEFIRRCPKYNSIHYFEPDHNNMERSKSALNKHPNINFLQYGASNKCGIARFLSDGSVSSIDSEGTQEVKLDTIDNLVQGPVTFIKMDIEGAEISAIDGAAETITKNHPILAISVYHHASDLWKIPMQIKKFCDNYNIYLRHYTEGVVETVMYFVPDNRMSQ